MANYERGVYEPSDEVRVFDGAEEDDDVEGSRLPLLIVLALLVLAMFGGVVWLAYTQGVARGRGETPVLTAAAGPERVAPQQPGGANVPYQGFKIYEQPAPSDDQGDAAPAAAPPQSAPSSAPTVAAARPPVAQPVPKPAPVVEKPVAATPPPALKPAVKTVVATPAQPTAAPAKPIITPKVVAPAPKAAATSPPKSVASLIQQADMAKAAPPPSAVLAGPASAAPRQLGQPVAATPAPVKATPPSALAKSGSYVLQIGAYKSQADADTAWKTYKAKHAALLSGYGPDVQQADLGEKGTWYRLRIAGFSDREVASGLCDRLKADSGSCFLGK